ncbi:Replicative DNA helicase [Anaerohalosphaera lusitana]|uniref:Replicative DNA helicase n=1 Tax=Anaerohalosphaera lusitana TaxID=1936003 RepID=A0A1U9NHC8_9BACT|nr:replicative DNA helicase [Anaerohalosphaera lusitana]AQT67332.1 Replicative DNA helicase [Anaerohalosphaera lusitana]
MAETSVGQNTYMGKRMPESLEAEAAVLGSMVIDSACIGQVVQTVTAENFYHPQHQPIYEALAALYERGGQIDLVLLRDELKKKNKLEEIGGVDYLVKVAESVPSAANFEYYAEIVHEKALLRQLIHASKEIMDKAFEEGEVAEKLNYAEKRVFEVTEKRMTGAALPMKNLLAEAFELIEAREGQRITGLPTGYWELDDLLCGMQHGEMSIIAARPSMGKTSFAMNVAEHIAADNNTPLVMFSLEMGKHQLVERMLCGRARVDAQKVRRGTLSTEETAILTETASELFEAPIFIDDTPGLTPLEMLGKCRRLKAQHDIQAVFIDYLQLMSLGGRVESRQQEVSTISRQLKSLARELDVPVVVLSQLNRAAEGRDGHRPRMSDLRDSGSIEQDADVIMLLHREDYYHRGDPEWEENNTAEIIVAKQRNGPTDTVKLTFNGQYTRFDNQSHADEPF